MNRCLVCVVTSALLCLPATVRAGPATQRQLDDQLVEAVVDGNTSRVRQLLAKGANPNSRGSDGSTPLTAASYTGQTESGYRPIEIVKLLLAHDARVDGLDSYGMTPLMVAASTSSMTAMRLLIERGAKVNARDRQGKTPLMHAAYAEGEAAYSNPVAVTFLIARGANVNARDHKGRTPLMMVAMVEEDTIGPSDSLRTAKLLLAANARTDLRDKKGDTALALAVRYRNRGIAAVLRDLSLQRRKAKGHKAIREQGHR